MFSDYSIPMHFNYVVKNYVVGPSWPVGSLSLPISYLFYPIKYLINVSVHKHLSSDEETFVNTKKTTNKNINIKKGTDNP